MSHKDEYLKELENYLTSHKEEVRQYCTELKAIMPKWNFNSYIPFLGNCPTKIYECDNTEEFLAKFGKPAQESEWYGKYIQPLKDSPGYGLSNVGPNYYGNYMPYTSAILAQAKDTGNVFVLDKISSEMQSDRDFQNFSNERSELIREIIRTEGADILFDAA